MIYKLVGRIGILFLFVLVVAACGTDNPPTGADWCFRFYFKFSQYDVAITDGFWFDGIGFQPDETGHLRLTYNQTLIVVPDAVVLTIARGEGVEGDIDVASAGEIFGIDATQSGTIPADQDNFNLRLFPENAGDGSSFFNISAVAEDTLNVEALTVWGEGASPFPTDNCSGTPTPVPTDPLPTSTGTIATPTPSPTLTPSETHTPSNTPTASPTITVCQVLEIDFDGLNDDKYDAPDNTLDTSLRGSGLALRGVVIGGTTYSEFYLELPATAVITRIRFDSYNTGGEILYMYPDGEVFATTPVPTGQDALEDFDDMDYSVALHGDGDHSIRIASNAADSGDTSVDNIVVNYCINDATPTPTNTPNLTWTRTFTPPPLQTNTPGTGTPTLIRTATATFIPINTLPPVATFPPPLATSTHLTTATPFGTPAGTPGGTSTPWTPVPLTGTPFDGEPWATSVGPGIGPGGGGDHGIGEGSGCVNSGIVSLICNVINTSSNAMQQAFGYVSAFGGRAIGIVNAYQEAEPLPIPGLPHCATDRLGSELCAIYYILTWTVLSGPVGSLIITVAVIDVDILVLFTFVKLARAILARLAGMLAQ